MSLVLLATAASANESPMRISDVRFADLNDTSQIEVVGTLFDQGTFPIVTLDGVAINVTDASATLIKAELPGTTTDGEYTIGVSTGPGNKQNAEHGLTVAPLEAMSVVCIDWFLTTGQEVHIHTEMHVEDSSGNPVIGARVSWESSRDGEVYQTPSSATTNKKGRNSGGGCISPAGSGVTDWFCCIGGGTGQGGPDGKKACEGGEYRADIVSVESPPGTTLVWDGDTPANTRFFDPNL